MSSPNNQNRVLALDVRARSFGFVAFEGSRRLLDWGVRSFRQGVNAAKIPAEKKIATLMDEFCPRVVVLRKRAVDKNKKRCRMGKATLRQAEKRRIPVRLLSQRTVKNAFADHGRNKYTIASALAERFPELASRLPPKRKIWQSEDYRMSIFDAAALGVAYFARGVGRTNENPPGIPPPS